MPLFPKHRPHPDITNPFAFRYFVDFLRRNWLVWTVLVGGTVWFYFWVGAEAWRLIREDIQISGVSIVRHSPPVQPISGAISEGLFGSLTSTFLDGLTRPIVGIEQSGTAMFFERIGPYLWILEAQTGETLASFEFNARSEDILIHGFSVYGRDGSSIYISVVYSSDIFRQRLVGARRSLRPGFLGRIYYHALVRFIGELSETAIFRFDIDSGEVTEVSRFETTLDLEGFLSDSGHGYGVAWKTPYKGQLAITNVSMDQLELIPLEAIDVGLSEKGEILILSDDHLFALDEVTGKTRIVPGDLNRLRIYGFRSHHYPRIKRAVVLETMYQKNPRTGLNEPLVILCQLPQRGNSLAYEFDESMLFMDPSAMQSSTTQPLPAPPTTDIRDVYTSSTLPMLFVGEDHLLRATEDGWKLEHLDDFLKAHPPRQIDLNQFR